MTYEWESMVTEETLDEINDLLPIGVVLVGVAVMHVENAEGAMIDRHGFEPSLDMADVWADISGDTRQHYGFVQAVVFGGKS